jgi:hypothetical protein
VIAASRDFVCARLATYESKSEAEMLGSLFVGRSGQLENTTFAILAPDGKKKLVRAGRGPMFAFGGPDGAEQMADTMRRIAKQYPARRTRSAPGLALTESVRLGLNIAACDHLPLVAVVASSKEKRAALEERLAKQAWSDAFIGRFIYAATTSTKDLKPVEGAKASDGFVVIEPGRFGLAGKALVHVPAAASDAALAAGLTKGLRKFTPTPGGDIRAHRRAGQRAGVHWETEIPVTDPGGPPPGRGGRPPR